MQTNITNPRRILVAGATGTIGRAVVKRLVEDGHAVTALLRASSTDGQLPELVGANLAQASLNDPKRLAQVCAATTPDIVISCIASRSGAPKDAQAIDYQANLALLTVALGAGAQQFILLSAICVQRPLLAFQHAKLFSFIFKPCHQVRELIQCPGWLLPSGHKILTP